MNNFDPMDAINRQVRKSQMEIQKISENIQKEKQEKKELDKAMLATQMETAANTRFLADLVWLVKKIMIIRTKYLNYS
jgi:hypothetical protein